MDRPLDDVISERQRGSNRGRRPGRYNEGPRDGVRKTNQRDSNRDIDRDWVHDRYEGDNFTRRAPRENTRGRRDRVSPAVEDEGREAPAKLRIDNLHYDITESDIRELFDRIGPVKDAEILYDRSDRSSGVAYVTYFEGRDALSAIRQYDGANAHGQPIKLSLLPSGPGRGRGGRNPLDAAIKPSRSLFDRIDDPNRARGTRSASPGGRRSNVAKPAPDNIDRYVPGQTRSRSPRPRRGGGGDRGRRPGARRENSGRMDRDGRSMVQGRPRKTKDELDAEMMDYWGGDGEDPGDTSGAPAPVPISGDAAVPGGGDEDVDMIE